MEGEVVMDEPKYTSNGICPCCHERVVENSSEAAALGEIIFHKTCVRKMIHRAKKEGLEIEFVWSERVCTGIKFSARPIPLPIPQPSELQIHGV
jgi:hypothetical protein